MKEHYCMRKLIAAVIAVTVLFSAGAFADDLSALILYPVQMLRTTT